MSAVWSLPLEALSFMRSHVRPAHATVVELGSGDGTAALLDVFDEVHTVEHDAAWIDRVHGVRYVHAPIKDGWYDVAAVEASLPEQIDCLIVDGPPAQIGRKGLLLHLELFGDCPVVVDDVHRRPDFEVAAAIAHRRALPLSVHHLPSGRAFATIGWGDL